jgi:hypothetical protein
MRAGFCAAALSLLLASAAAAAPPISLGVDAGVATDISGWRSAPSLQLQGAVGLTRQLALAARMEGWTLPGVGLAVANSELTASIGLSYTQPLSPVLFLNAVAGPAMTFLTRAGAPLESVPGALVNPALVFATRRRTLALEVGAQALVFAQGLRLGATAGVTYTFW